MDGPGIHGGIPSGLISASLSGLGSGTPRLQFTMGDTVHLWSRAAALRSIQKGCIIGNVLRDPKSSSLVTFFILTGSTLAPASATERATGTYSTYLADGAIRCYLKGGASMVRGRSANRT